MRSYDVSHIHTIFNHKGTNLLKKDKISLEYSDKNEFTHLYTLHLKPDGTYEVFFDLTSKASGNLVDHWDFPKKEIDDPNDKKPSDWVDETEIDDPEDKKPDGYDDIPAQIPDPDATKPEDWDDEDDGEWEVRTALFPPPPPPPPPVCRPRAPLSPPYGSPLCLAATFLPPSCRLTPRRL